MKTRANKNMPRKGSKTITIDSDTFEDAKDISYLQSETIKTITAVAIEEYIKKRGLRKKITETRKLRQSTK